VGFVCFRDSSFEYTRRAGDFERIPPHPCFIPSKTVTDESVCVVARIGRPAAAGCAREFVGGHVVARLERVFIRGRASGEAPWQVTATLTRD
jgi:hypothetical protein